MFRSLSVFFCTLGFFLCAASARAQDCNSQLAGAQGQGGQCSIEGFPQILGFSPFGPQQFTAHTEPGGSSPRGPQGDGIVTDWGPTKGSMPTVVENGSGSVDQATGAYQFNVGLAAIRGLMPGAGVLIKAKYRSYLASENSVTTGPADPTGGMSPFGVGWAASFAGGPVKGAVPGNEIEYIDSDGVRWKTGLPAVTEQAQDPYGPAGVTTNHIYPAIKGQRWIYMGNTWYRELPNRVLIEYAARSTTGLANHVVGSHPIRAFLADPGNPTNPLWEVTYTYVNDELRSMQGDGLLGYVLTCEWSTVSGYRRITKVKISCPRVTAFSSWTQYDVVLDYDTGGQLKTVRYPQRTIRYKPDGTFDSSPYLPAYDQKGYKFTYAAKPSGGGSVMLHKVERELLSGTSWVGETLYTNTYDTTAHWRITQQDVRGPSQSIDRIHLFSYSTVSGKTQVQWTDPHGIKHRFLPTEDVSATTDPRKIFVAKYTLVPKVGDPSGYGNQDWHFTYDSCTCGAVERVTLPSGRIYEYDYDPEGRLFVTKITQMIAGATSPRVWERNYHTWGKPWVQTDWQKASRLTSVKQENGKTWIFAYSSGITSITAPSPLSYVWTITEDSKERVTEVLEPAHHVDGGTTTAQKKTKFVWGSDSAAFTFERVVMVEQYLDAGTRTITLTYDELARISAITDVGGEFTSYTYDRAGNLTQVALPSVVSGRDATKTIAGVTIDVDYGVDGDITRVQKRWLNDEGVANAHLKTDYQVSYNIFGERRKEREDAQKHDTAAVLWLETTRTYDPISRLTEIKNEYNAQHVKYTIDSFDMVQAVEMFDNTGWPKREFDYDLDGNVTLSEDATGQTTKSFYDSHARLERVEQWGSASQAQRTTTYTYPSGSGAGYLDRPEKLLFKLDPSNSSGLQDILERQWTRDDLGRITAISSTDKLASITKGSAAVTWTGPWRMATRTDENGRTTTYGYDTAGYLRFTEDPLGNRTKVIRNIENEVATVERIVKKDGTGGITDVTYATDYTYDDLGRVLTSTRRGNTAVTGTNAIRKYGYDSLGNLTYFLDAADKRIDRDFDALGRMRETRRYPRGGGPHVSNTVAIYDRASDALAALGSFTTDVLGHQYLATNLSMLVERKDHRQMKTSFIYDALGHLVERRTPGYQGPGLGHAWTYRYDDEGRLDQWITGNNHVIHQERDDPFARVTRRWHAPGNVGVYTPLSTLSLMNAGEEWAYDEITGGKIVYEARTMAEAWLPQTGYGSSRRLINERRSFDAFGLMHAEEFGFTHNGTATASKSLKTMTHDWSSTRDTGFRHGLNYASGWSFDFVPDAAAKRSTMTMTDPGSTSWLAGKWFYEGNRTYRREVTLDTAMSTTNWFKTTWDVDKHGYISGITAMHGTASPTTVFSLTQEQNLEGFVTKKKYTKIATVGGGAAAGDRFLLDGFDRLAEAKLGVSSAQIDATSYSSITQFDKRIEYALDLAQNRSGANGTVVTQGASSSSTNYALDAASNRYSSVGGVSITYDGNGNLIWDGSKYFVYDYLDRLSEIFIWTEGTGSSSQQAMTSSGLRLQMSTKDLRSFASFADSQKVSVKGVKPGGVEDVNRSLKAACGSRSKRSSSTQSSSGPQFLLLALYGYDNGNRRVLRAVSGDTEGARWATWDGWQQAEEYEDNNTSNFKPRKVFFRGRGLTDTLGFAISSNGSTWTKYALIQGTLGKAVATYTHDGVHKETYEYDPYGYRYGYKPNGSGGYTALVGLGTEIEQYESAGGGRVDWETQNIYLRNRYLNTQIGRFKTRDPLGAWADGTSWGNGYGYGKNGPNSLFDPLGLMVWSGPEDQYAIWIEGASGDELLLHLGISVGIRGGKYRTFSWATPTPWWPFGGEAYEERDLGGPIDGGEYYPVTRKQARSIAEWFDHGWLGKTGDGKSNPVKGSYGFRASCRGWSYNALKTLVKRHNLKKASPPDGLSGGNSSRSAWCLGVSSISSSVSASSSAVPSAIPSVVATAAGMARVATTTGGTGIGLIAGEMEAGGPSGIAGSGSIGGTRGGMTGSGEPPVWHGRNQ